MDKDEARLILRCFRPDGADASGEDFAEALRLAAEDRELGEWLAGERAFDARFAQALGSLSLPQELRREILENLAHARGEAGADEPLDASMIDALSTIPVPQALRTELLTAMDQSRRGSRAESRRGSLRWGLGAAFAAAAGIALAFVLIREPAPVPGGVVTHDPSAMSGSLAVQDLRSAAVPVNHVVDGALSTLRSGFTLDLKNPDHQEIFQFIHNSKRICPGPCLPKKLQDLPGIGCRKIEIDGKPGAIICFRAASGEAVHLVVFRREDLSGELPDPLHPRLTGHDGWSVAEWEQDGRALFLMGDLPAGALRDFFGGSRDGGSELR